MTLPVTNIQRFCMHDGPGIRTTVFLKGCPLRCRWCHNMETQHAEQQILFYSDKCMQCRACAVCPREAHSFRDGKHLFDRKRCEGCGLCTQVCPAKALEASFRVMRIEEILEQVRKDTAFYGEEGGLTVSGGEPMAHPKQTLTLLKAAKAEGISTAVETCGYFAPQYVEDLCSCTDTLLWDIKDTNDARHQRNTGVSNKQILQNLFAADQYDADIVIRCIILKGINLEAEHLQAVYDIFQSLRRCRRVEFLPCHQFGEAKAAALGMDYEDLAQYVPSEQDMNFVRSFAVWEK